MVALHQTMPAYLTQALPRRGKVRQSLTFLSVVWGALLLLSPQGRGEPVPQKAASLNTGKAEAAMRAGKYDVAVQEYERLLKLWPQSAELWSNLGSVQVLRGDCVRALLSLEKARALNSTLFAPWYFSGFCHLQAHEEDQALQDLRHAVDLNPREVNAWYLLAQAAGNFGQVNVAFDASSRALELDLTRPEAYYTAGKAALDLAVECYARLHPDPEANPYIQRLEGERDAAQGVWESATAAFRNAAQLDPQAPDVRYALALAYEANGNFSQAEAELQKCLRLLPGSTLARIDLAKVLAQEQKTQDAVKALKSVPVNAFGAKEEFEAYLACALLLQEPEAENAALREAARHFANNPAFAQWKSPPGPPAAEEGEPHRPALEAQQSSTVGQAVRFLLISNPARGNFVAGVFGSASRYRQFRTAFLRDDIVETGRLLARASLHVPAEPRQAFALGELLQWLAFRLHETLARRFPDSDAAQMLAAENLSSAGNQDRALEIYRALSERKGPSIPVLRAIAQIYWIERRWDEALKVLHDLVEDDPKDATLYVNLGRIYSYRGDWANAQQYFERAAQIDPRMFEAHLGLGETLRQEGDEEGALRELRAAAQADPENPRPHYGLSQIYRKAEKLDLARQEMETFQRLQARAPTERSLKERLLVPVD